MSGELVGREEELHRVELFLEAARHAPRVLVIEGEAGAGKTSIWEAALASAQGAGSDTVAARPAETETTFAYAALADLMRDRKATERVSRSTLATTTGTRRARAAASAASSCGRADSRPDSISVNSAMMRQLPPFK